MPRTLSTAYSTAISQNAVAPIWFVEIGFSTPLRLTSGASCTWNSLSWTESKMDIKGIKFDGTITQNVTIDLFDPLEAYITLCVSQKLTKRSINIWISEAGTLAAGDPIQCAPLIGVNWKQPRRYSAQISAASALNKTLPTGTWRAILPDVLFLQQELTLQWGNGTLKLSPRTQTVY